MLSVIILLFEITAHLITETKKQKNYLVLQNINQMSKVNDFLFIFYTSFFVIIFVFLHFIFLESKNQKNRLDLQILI